MTRMTVITSPDILKDVRDRIKPGLDHRTKPSDDKDDSKRYVLVCTGGGCIASGALDVKAALEKEIKKI